MAVWSVRFCFERRGKEETGLSWVKFQDFAFEIAIFFDL